VHLATTAERRPRTARPLSTANRPKVTAGSRPKVTARLPPVTAADLRPLGTARLAPQGTGKPPQVMGRPPQVTGSPPQVTADRPPMARLRAGTTPAVMRRPPLAWCRQVAPGSRPCRIPSANPACETP